MGNFTGSAGFGELMAGRAWVLQLEGEGNRQRAIADMFRGCCL